MERQTLNVVEIAKYLGISKDLIYQLVRENRIPHLKVGRRILFRIISINRWLQDVEEGSIKQ